MTWTPGAGLGFGFFGLLGQRLEMGLAGFSRTMFAALVGTQGLIGMAFEDRCVDLCVNQGAIYVVSRIWRWRCEMLSEMELRHTEQFPSVCGK